MRQYLISILFFLVFSAQSFAQAFIVLSYYVNTAPFAKACENKAKPQLHCNGKCQMMKKLQEEEKKNGQLPERKMEIKNEVVSCGSFFPTAPDFKNLFANRVYASMVIPKATDRSLDVFRPPCTVSLG